VKEINLNELDFSNIGKWPTALKVALIIIACVAVGVAGFFLDIKDQIAKLDRAAK
jgi:type IV pilus assembly protein PilO